MSEETNKSKKILYNLNQSSKNDVDITVTWNEWLSWCCCAFDWKEIVNVGGLPQRLSACKDDNLKYYEAMSGWLELASDGISKYGAYDAFGALYEKYIQSSHKASSNGQFFTPTSVCDVMAEISLDDKCMKPTTEVVTFNDCTCGSGRTLLSAWNSCDKYNRNLFFAGDLDTTSVKMCALNFMVHGMVGAVEKRDALTKEWFFGYIVNGCKVPVSNNYVCLQYYDNEADYLKSVERLIDSAKKWDCVKYKKEIINNGKEKEEYHKI